MKLNQILQGIKVVELASVLAGPLAGSFLAELGAEVIKIENGPAGGDVTRSWKLPEEEADYPTSAYYHSANYGKKVLMLDLKSEGDRKKLQHELVNADIILSNFQKHTALKLGVDIDNLQNMNSGAVIIQLNAFDYEDPRAGYDLVMQAESGFISMCGTDAGHLAKMPVAMIDIIAAHQIKEAVLLGLLHKNKSVAGSVFHVSLYRSALSALVNQGTNYLMEGHVAQPMGTMHPNIAPYGEIVYASDGNAFMLAVGSDGQFAKLVTNLEWSKDDISRFETNKQRLAQRQPLLEMLQSGFQGKTAKELTIILESNNIPFAKVRSLDEVLNDDQALSMIRENPAEGRPDGKYISNIAFDAEFYSGQ